MESKLSNGIRFLITTGQFQKAHSHATFLIEEAIRTNNIELQLTSYLQRLKLYIQNQAIEQATADLHKCEQLINEHSEYERYRGVVYCASGMLNTLTSNHTVAYEQLSLAISFAYEHDDWLTVSTAYAKMSALPQLSFDEALPLARTAVLFAHRVEHSNDLYVARALLHIVQLYLQTNHVAEALPLFEELQQLLTKHDYVREQLQTETLWLHYYAAQHQYDAVLAKFPALIEKLQHYNQCDLYSDALCIVKETYTQLQQLQEAQHYEELFEQQQAMLQQHPISNQLVEDAPSHFEGLALFKEQAQQYIQDHAGYALLLFYIESAEPLAYERTQQIFDKLQFFLAQTNLTLITQNTFETHKVLYVVKEGFIDALPHIQRAVSQTLLHVKEPIDLLFGHTHNVEHDTFSFEECLAVCHAYLYYNQWALAEKI